MDTNQYEDIVNFLLEHYKLFLVNNSYTTTESEMYTSSTNIILTANSNGTLASLEERQQTIKYAYITDFEIKLQYNSPIEEQPCIESCQRT